jgi:hypothetical protein
MRTYGRYPSLYQSLDAQHVQELEDYALLSLVGDFPTAEKIWSSSLQKRPRAFVNDIAHIDSLLRQIDMATSATTLLYSPLRRQIRAPYILQLK